MILISELLPHTEEHISSQVTARISLEVSAEEGERRQQKLLPEVRFISPEFTHLEVRCLQQAHSQRGHTGIIRS